MSKRKNQKQNRSQIIYLTLGLIVALSMVVSLFIGSLPEPATPTPTPWPTWTPFILPTDVPTPSPSPVPLGPVLPTATVTPTITPTLTSIPAAVVPTTHTSTTAAAVSAHDTPAVADSAFVFAVCGDSRSNPDQYRKLLQAVMADGSEFLINTGDLVNHGTEPEWQAFLVPMAGFTLPFYPVPGNHDGLDGKLDGYLNYSGAPAAHYSFDRDLVHLTLADSHGGGVTASEMAWLRHDLSATKQPVKMVFLHHPPFDPDGTDHIMAFGSEPFMALMAEQGVDYVFAGHIHAFAQAERDGVVYTITGGGGAPLYSVAHPQAFYHYLRVTVRSEQVTIEAIKV
jgi:3',5'-cyclic AMP phosphodiesterase CpdA